MKTLEHSPRFLSPFFFYTFDQESGYHHVSTVKNDQKVLAFVWPFCNGNGMYFTFKVLPFGLSTACYVFTKLLRALVGRWRSMGQVSFVYIDDGVTGARDRSAKAGHDN